jgi:hypothetical protein
MEAHRILFRIGFLTDEPKNPFSVRAHSSSARRWDLFGKLDNPIGSRDGVEAAALHIVESCGEGIEGFPVQLALLRCHLFCNSLESHSRLGWPTSSHVSGNSQNHINAKRLQLGAVNGGKRVESGLRCTRRAIEGKRQCGRHRTDLDNSPSRLPQCGKKGIHDGESAEDVHFEFVPDGVKRQNL